MKRISSFVVIVAALISLSTHAALPGAVARAFKDAGIPLDRVAIVVRETGSPRPLFAHDPDRPMNPASVMKLVTTFAALELLGRDYRWKTEAYVDGKLDAAGTLTGNLLLKGYGDPKITIEQWQLFMADLRARGVSKITGDLVLDRTFFKLPPHDPAAFDQEPQRPYNVGPDALLVNFKSLRFGFVPDAQKNLVAVKVDPPLPEIAVDALPQLAGSDCGDWRATIAANFVNNASVASASFPGRYARNCGERDWYVSLLDHQHYVHGMFETYFRAVGGNFTGGVKDGRAPRNATPIAVLESAPLYDVVRDVNKLSNNVMARQIFLTLATTRHPPPATIPLATDVVQHWLQEKKLALPGLVLENGSGLSRQERITAGGLSRLLIAADASSVREEFASSLAVAALDGTLQKRFLNGAVSGQAFLKTGSLEGVRALAGYVIDAEGRRFTVVAIINHPNAVRGAAALDLLVAWVYRDARSWDPALHR
ncbi:MAG: D-alanyl-D-alanine carboxypeptidase/D-alanyl-D-alanine-endopeptidase [Betaproteobacteria bacterium]